MFYYIAYFDVGVSCILLSHFFNTALLAGYHDPVVFVLCGLLLEEKQVDCTQNQEDCLLWQGLVVKCIIIIVSYIYYVA